MAHLRYPEDLFKVQREPARAVPRDRRRQTFYSGSDFWSVPDDPTQGDGAAAAAAVLPARCRCPARPTPAFSLTTTFVAADSADDLAAFMAVDADPGTDYGKIRVLRAARATRRSRARAGAEQLRVRPDVVAEQLTLLRSGDSDGRVRQPADPAGRRRPALRRAGLRPAPRGTDVPAAAARCWSAFGDNVALRGHPRARRSTRCSAPAPARPRRPPPTGHHEAPDAALPDAALEAAIAGRPGAPSRPASRPSRSGDWAAYGRRRRTGSRSALATATAAEREHRRAAAGATTSASPRRVRERAPPPDRLSSGICPGPAVADVRLAHAERRRGVEQLGSSLGS